MNKKTICKPRNQSTPGRKPRDTSFDRHVVSIKLTGEEYKQVLEKAKQYGGNLNAMYRAKILG